MAFMRRIKRTIKYLSAPLIYRYPPCGLEPAGLATYLGYLLQRRDVVGDVAEIGCSFGGTAVFAASVLQKYSPEKTYYCFDTFSGFVEDQFDSDLSQGTPLQARHRYSANSLGLVRRILDLHECQDVVLVKGDVKKIDESRLSTSYSVVFLDVDLSEPTYAALVKFYPRLTDGGIILVDDCSDEPEQIWRARMGYKRFCSEHGLTERFEYGLGVIEKE